MSWIGFCNRTENVCWSEVRSAYVEDCPGKITKRQFVGEGMWQFTSQTTIVDTRSMRPFGQIALDWEQCLVDMARRALESLGPRVKTLAWKVDGVYYLNKGFDRDLVRNMMDGPQFKYPSGVPMFKIKGETPQDEQSVINVPTWKRKKEDRSFKLNIDNAIWRRLTEADGAADPQTYFAEEIVKNGGGLLLGLGGTGKTEVLKRLDAILSKKSGNHVIIDESREMTQAIFCAMRHAAAAQLPQGQTIAHLLHKYAKAQNKWLICDEAWEVCLAMIADLARFKLVGWHFVFVGDHEGQMLPMFDRWSDVMNGRNIVNSRLMYDLVNGLSFSAFAGELWTTGPTSRS